MVDTGSAGPLCPGLGRAGAVRSAGLVVPFSTELRKDGGGLGCSEQRTGAALSSFTVQFVLFFFFLTTQIHVQSSSRFLKVQWHPLYMLLLTILTQF